MCSSRLTILLYTCKCCYWSYLQIRQPFANYCERWQKWVFSPKVRVWASARGRPRALSAPFQKIKVQGPWIRRITMNTCILKQVLSSAALMKLRHALKSFSDSSPVWGAVRSSMTGLPTGNVQQVTSVSYKVWNNHKAVVKRLAFH